MKAACSSVGLLCAGVLSVGYAQRFPPSVPTLKVEVESMTSVVLSWPYPSVGFVLESASRLSGPDAWLLHSSVPAMEEGRYRVRVEIIGEQRFFRLRSLYPGGQPPDPAAIAPRLVRTEFTDLGSATAFLYSGLEPIQTGVTHGAIEPRRAGVLCGRVLRRDGQALASVQITVVGHPEFGGTLSRADGRFDIAVNGGGLLVVDYQKLGFLPAQRQVRVPWQEYIELPDVVLIPLDAQATTVVLGSNAPMQVARGSLSSDADGQRQATLLFAPETEAGIFLPDGSTQALTQLTVRATEFTVGLNGPKAMPAELPAGVGYTYAVALTADEALAAGVKVAGKDVLFSKPVIFYVENFLKFPVGGVVPLAFYDGNTGWVPYENGRVLKILGATGGKADLDTDGDGVAENDLELATLGITEQERASLTTLHPPGQELWRMALSHFSVWDANWLWGPALEAVAPMISSSRLDFFREKRAREPTCPESGGSVIGSQDQTLIESFAVTGTPFRLVYASDRTPGRKTDYFLDIPLSTETLPAELRRIDLEVFVGGRVFTSTFPPLTNQVHRFTWDGRDAYGREVVGVQRVRVRVGYVYPGYYYESKQDLDRAFGHTGNGVPITANRARQEFIMWQEWNAALGPWDARGQGLGGWTLSVHHAYDAAGPILYLGNGEQRRQEAGVSAIKRVAGTGHNAGTSIGGFNGEDRFAVDAYLSQPSGVTIAPNGDLFIADSRNGRVRRVGSDGMIRLFAGGGNPPDGLGDGGPASNAILRWPSDVAIGPDGSLYIAERDGPRIRRVDPAGIISTAAGGGNPDDGLGDGGPATAARLNQPNAVAVSPDGGLYIADTANHRVREVSLDGTIRTLAGTGVAGFNGDDLPAAETQLKYPTGVALGPDGSVYVADSQNSRIRRVTRDGGCETIAGAGSLWPDDGVPAHQVSIGWPNRVAVGPEGAVYFSGQRWGWRVYRVGADGLLTTVAGPRAQDVVAIPSYRGDGGPAVGALMNQPHGIAVSPDRTLYVADWLNHVIRTVTRPLPGFEGVGFSLPSEDGSLLYEFDSRGRHRRTVNSLTAATVYSFTYDDRGLLVAVEDGDHNVTTIERAGDGTPTAIVAPFGQRTTLAIGADAYLRRIADPLNHGLDLTYTQEGLLTTATDPRGRISIFSYDSVGRLIKDENSGCCFRELSRSETNGTYTVTLTSAEGLQTRFGVGYLPSGEQTRINQFPDGTTNRLVLGTDSSVDLMSADRTRTTTAQDGDPRFGMQAPFTKSLQITHPAGRTFLKNSELAAGLSNASDPLSLQSLTNRVVVNGRTNLTVYDATTRTTTFTSPEGRQQASRLDAQGRLVEASLPGIAPTRFSYDARGRLARLGQGERQAGFGFDPTTGWLTSATNADNQVTAYELDAAGRTTRLTQADQATWEFGYDASDNLVALTEPNGANQHTFIYTPQNLLESYRSPLGAIELFSYDKDRRLIQRQFPSGQTLQWHYNSKGQMAVFQTPQGDHTFRYDPTTGFLSEALSRDGQRVTNRYDGSLLTSVTWGGVVTSTVSYAYNNDFQVSQMAYAGLNLPLGYDGDGLLTNVGSIALTHNATNGFLTRVADGPFTIAYERNEFGEITKTVATQGAELYRAERSYDVLGRIARKVETIYGVTATWDYAYDAVGQLVEVKRDGVVVEAYAYDAVGNRIGMTNTLTGQTLSATDYRYDADHKLLHAGATSFTYDTDGRLSASTRTGTTTAFHYASDGALSGVDLPDGRQVTYLHDAAGRRIARAVNGVRTHAWLYGGGLLPLAEFDGNGVLLTTFIYARASIPLVLRRGGVTYRIVADHLGSPRLVLDASGAMVKRVDYDTFGNVIADSNPLFGLPFGFAGGLRDPDHELIRFGARDYQPSTARWTAKDPVLFAGGSHLYRFVANNPVGSVDRWGTQPEEMEVEFQGTIVRIPAEVPSSCLNTTGASEWIAKHPFGDVQHEAKVQQQAKAAADRWIRCFGTGQKDKAINEMGYVAMQPQGHLWLSRIIRQMQNTATGRDPVAALFPGGTKAAQQALASAVQVQADPARYYKPNPVKEFFDSILGTGPEVTIRVLRLP